MNSAATSESEPNFQLQNAGNLNNQDNEEYKMKNQTENNIICAINIIKQRWITLQHR